MQRALGDFFLIVFLLFHYFRIKLYNKINIKVSINSLKGFKIYFKIIHENENIKLTFKMC